jgi:hypothetical protein
MPDEILHDALAARSERELEANAQALFSLRDHERVVVRATTQAVAHAWSQGWQPRDLARAAERTPYVAGGWMASAIVIQAREYLHGPFVDPGWRAQVEELAPVDDGADPVAHLGGCSVVDLTSILRCLRWLVRLPSMPRTVTPPDQWSSSSPPHLVTGPDDAVVAKVRALLAKAESTDYPAEADALTAKAQELIARHAIDRLLLEPTPERAPTSINVHVDEPYARAKALLLAGVAHANGCRTVTNLQWGITTVFGYARDLATVQLLHASLLVQATRAVDAAGRGAPVGHRTRGRAFRRSFLLGFASEVAGRLRATVDAETAQADATAGGSLLPVLARRDRAVDAALQQAYPRLGRGRRTTVGDGAGFAAGQVAGRTADLSLDPEVAPHLGEAPVRGCPP